MKLNRKSVEMQLAKQGLLKSELCSNAGITRASLNLALKGKSEPRPKTIGKIALALNVPIEEIIQKEVKTNEYTCK